MENTRHDAITIGTGHNGPVTVTHPAEEGLDVLVLEPLNRVGLTDPSFIYTDTLPHVMNVVYYSKSLKGEINNV